MKILVGLGNPGQEYRSTRHNIGFMVMDFLASRFRVSFSRRGFFSIRAEGSVEGEPVVLAKPLTYMNLSGKALAALAGKYSLPASHLLVICDDLNLSPGVIRLRAGGSAGGHKGLISIIETLGTKDFPRLRVGIGNPPPGMDARDYVLEPPGAEETAALEAGVEEAAEAVVCFLKEGLPAAMNRFNRKKQLKSDV
ncbi:MAG: aminoacyl-tRNA hydrolase [bacterium]